MPRHIHTGASIRAIDGQAFLRLLPAFGKDFTFTILQHLMRDPRLHHSRKVLAEFFPRFIRPGLLVTHHLFLLTTDCRRMGSADRPPSQAPLHAHRLSPRRASSPPVQHPPCRSPLAAPSTPIWAAASTTPLSPPSASSPLLSMLLRRTPMASRMQPNWGMPSWTACPATLTL